MKKIAVLLTIVLAAAIFSLLMLVEARKGRAAAMALRSNGFEVRYFSEAKNHRTVDNMFRHYLSADINVQDHVYKVQATGELTDRDVANIGAQTQLVALYLGGTDCSDSDLRRLSHLTRVSIVDLSGTAVTDEGVKAFIARRRHLNIISLERTGITQECVDDIRRVFPNATVFTSLGK